MPAFRTAFWRQTFDPHPEEGDEVLHQSLSFPCG